MVKVYKSFGELSDQETEGQDYAIRTCLRNGPVLVMAPHGGKIEPGTTKVAEAIAGNDHSFYSCDGIYSPFAFLRRRRGGLGLDVPW
jgi:phage replication-related protein YjqB (UPF0714/DUF867 family)